MNEEVNKMKLCILCQDGEKDGIKWEYPKEGHYKGTYHFKFGKRYEPLLGHKDYETHLKWKELLNPLNKG